MSMRVLITGATGFIGQTLVEQLLYKGIAVRALTRHLQPGLALKYPTIDWRQADVTHPESLKCVCDDIDVIFHLAGFAHAWEEENADFAQQHQVVNLHGTMALAHIAAQAGVKRFIFFSTVKAGDQPLETAYAIAKHQAEQQLLDLSESSDLATIILRPALVYGIGWKGNLSTMLEAINKGIFPPLPPIQNKKSMVSVKDLCRAAYLAAIVSLPSQKIFIVSDQQDYSSYQIYQSMRAVLGKKPNKFYLPFVIWKLFALLGDVTQKISRRRLPINSQAVQKLFANMQYEDKHTQSALGFEPQDTFDSVLPEIMENH